MPTLADEVVVEFPCVKPLFQARPKFVFDNDAVVVGIEMFNKVRLDIFQFIKFPYEKFWVEFYYQRYTHGFLFDGSTDDFRFNYFTLAEGQKHPFNSNDPPSGTSFVSGSLKRNFADGEVTLRIDGISPDAATRN